MKNRVKINNFYFYILIIFILILTLFIFLNNNRTLEITSLQHKVEFNPYITNCYGNFLGNVDSLNLNKNKQPRDIYLSQDIENIKCLGQIVDVSFDEDSVTVFYARNLKVNLIFHLILAFAVGGLAFLKFKKLFYSFILFHQLIYFFLNKYLFSFKNVTMNLFLIATIFIGIQFVFFDLKNHELIRKINSYLIKFDNYITLNIKLFKLKTPTFLLYFLISLSSIILGIIKFQSRSKFEYFNDELIQIMTAAKSYYFSFTSIESALLNHTPINSQIFRFIFQFSDFKNFDFGIVILETIFATFTTLIIFLILNSFSNKHIVNFLFSFFYLIFISSNLLLNRIIAQFIYALLILFLISFVNKKNDAKLFAIALLAMLQIYNLESYAVPLFAIFLYMVQHIFNKDNILIFKTIIYSLFSIILIYINFVINNEIALLFESNYLFHLLNTKRMFNVNTFINSLGGSSQLSIAHIVFIIIFLRGIYFLVSSLSGKNLIKYKKYELLFVYWFAGELLHLFVTGPRFPHYGLVLVLPSFFIIYIYAVDYYESKRFTSFVIVITLLFGYFIGSIQVFYSYILDDTKVTAQEYLDTEDKKIITEILSNELSGEEPTLVLTWINAYDWRFLHLNLNTLPSTKYWWWFYMKYFQEEKYKWENNWDEETIVNDFYSDFENENPKWAVVDKNIPTFPDFFAELLLENYIVEFEGSQFNLYKNKDY